jgi:membrane protease YdiL (CAAX protease family)
VTSAIETQPPRPWGFWATIGFFLAVMAAFLISALAVFTIFFVVELLDNPNLNIVEYAEDVETNGLVMSVTGIITGICCLPLIYWFAWLRRGYPVRDYLGLYLPSRSVVLKWLLVTVVLIFVLDMSTYLVEDSVVWDYMIEAYETAYFTPLLYFAVIVIAPIVEELLIRGFLITGIRASVLGATGAVILSSLIFAVMHIQYDLFGMSQCLVIGIVFGIARIRTGSTLLTILLHSLINTVATVELLIEVHFLS